MKECRLIQELLGKKGNLAPWLVYWRKFHPQSGELKTKMYNIQLKHLRQVKHLVWIKYRQSYEKTLAFARQVFMGFKQARESIGRPIYLYVS